MIRSDWKEIVGGPNSISLAGWAALFPWSIWLAIGYSPNRNAGVIFAWLVLGVTAHCMTGIVLLIAKNTYLRNLKLRPRPYLVISTFILGGIVRGFTTGYLSVSLGAATQYHFFPRVPIGAMLTPAWLILAAFVVHSARTYKGQVSLLVAYQEQLASAKEIYFEQINSYREASFKRIKLSVRKCLDEISLSDNVVESFLNASEDVIRPLSHEITLQQMDILKPELHVSELTKQSNHIPTHLRNMRMVTAFPVSYLPMLLLMTGLPAFVFTVGPVKAISSIALTVGSFISINWLAEKLTIKLRRRLPAILGWTIVILVWLFSALTIGFVNDFMLGHHPALSMIGPASMVLIFTATVFGSYYAATVLERGNLKSEISAIVVTSEWEERQAKALLSAEQSRIVEAVHGGIQSLMTASALKLSLSSDPMSEIPKLVSDLENATSNLLSQRIDVSQARGSIQSIIEVWHGVAEIELELTAEVEEVIKNSYLLAFSILAITREAISNAIRHGKAKNISVRFNVSGEDIEVVVTDDGALKMDKFSDGFGLIMYSKLSSSWKLSRTVDKQTELRLTIPVLQ